MFNNNDFVLDSLASGAFLSTGDNVMIIGWGGVGYFWRRKVFFAPVRFSRFTKEILDNTKAFALSFPEVGTMKDEIKLCGTKSGRDIDKKSMLKTFPATKTGTFFVDGCKEYMECKVLGALPMTSEMLEALPKEFYKDGDYHVLYVAEIL